MILPAHLISKMNFFSFVDGNQKHGGVSRRVGDADVHDGIGADRARMRGVDQYSEGVFTHVSL